MLASLMGNTFGLRCRLVPVKHTLQQIKCCLTVRFSTSKQVEGSTKVWACLGTNHRFFLQLSDPAASLALRLCAVCSDAGMR
jgi:hypothetical protein